MVIKNTIKIWPYWDDISPSIIPYSDTTLNLDKPIIIDFSEVKYTSSAGASIIIAKLLKIIDDNPGKSWGVYFGENQKCQQFLIQSGVATILNNRVHNKDMFWDLDDNNNNKSNYLESSDKKITQISFPLHAILNTNQLGRQNVELFIDWLITDVEPAFTGCDFRFNVFAKMLNEIAKNSCDHTGEDAYFGMDIYKIKDEFLSLTFTFSDLGMGIHQKVKKYKEGIGEDWSKKGIVDSYHFAFQPGNSTGGVINRGIGMSMIQECSNILGFNISIFDAYSMGIVPKDTSHSAIRANFYNTKSPVGFNYFGRVNL